MKGYKEIEEDTQGLCHEEIKDNKEMLLSKIKKEMREREKWESKSRVGMSKRM